VSPDGKQLAWRAPVDGVMNVWVAPVGDLKAARAVTKDKSRGVRIYFWAYSSQHIVYLQDRGGDENWRIYVVDLKSGEEKDLTPLDKVQARIEQVSPKFPDEILVALNDRVPQLHDIYRVNLKSGERKLVQQNEGFVGFTTDDDYKVRLAARYLPDGGLEMLKAGEGGFVPFAQVPAADSLTTNALGFDKSGQVLYMLDSRDRDTAALTKVDLASGKSELVFADSKADVANVLVHPTEKTLQAVSSSYLREEWKVLDPAIEARKGGARRFRDHRPVARRQGLDGGLRAGRRAGDLLPLRSADAQGDLPVHRAPGARRQGTHADASAGDQGAGRARAGQLPDAPRRLRRPSRCGTRRRPPGSRSRPP